MTKTVSKPYKLKYRCLECSKVLQKKKNQERVIGSLRQAASHGAEKVANTKHFYSMRHINSKVYFSKRKRRFGFCFNCDYG